MKDRTVTVNADDFFNVCMTTSALEIKKHKLMDEIEQLKSENAKLENANRIVQAELKRQYERVDALTAENSKLKLESDEQYDSGYTDAELELEHKYSLYDVIIKDLTAENKLLSERVKELEKDMREGYERSGTHQ